MMAVFKLIYQSVTILHKPAETGLSSKCILVVTGIKKNVAPLSKTEAFISGL